MVTSYKIMKAHGSLL